MEHLRREQVVMLQNVNWDAVFLVIRQNGRLRQIVLMKEIAKMIKSLRSGIMMKPLIPSLNVCLALSEIKKELVYLKMMVKRNVYLLLLKHVFRKREVKLILIRKEDFVLIRSLRQPAKHKITKDVLRAMKKSIGLILAGIRNR